ncbi:MAG TPA: ribosomal protein S18-alanine N-acetyltransferase [Polyangia bacterium]|nr:ribosomal protein S18-alanine N-acetyltransferase [Polyangia bacterium]
MSLSAPQPTTPGVPVERMRLDDIDAVLAIERECLRPTWTREAILEELGRDWARLDVVRDGAGAVVAFANYWLVADEVHLLNIATLPAHRRHGHGTRLLAHMIEVAQALPCRVITLEVRRSNEAAQRLYQRFAFRSVGVRPYYYTDDQEDAVVMVLELGSAARS